MFPGACRFVPSCSDYARAAVARYGALRGSWLAAKRLARCHPLCEGGFDPLPDGGLANYFRDITFRKRSEVKLRESEERLAADLAAMTRLQEVSTRLVPAGDSTPLLLEIVDVLVPVLADVIDRRDVLDGLYGGHRRPLYYRG